MGGNVRYSLERIFHNLYHNLFLYSIIMVNFALGVGFFMICMNFEKTSAEMLKESKGESLKDVIRVEQSVASKEDIFMDEYPISYDMYLRLSSDEKYVNDIAILFSMDFYENIYIHEPEQGVSLCTFFMNENLFYYLYGFTKKADVVYLGNTAYRNLTKIGEELRNNRKNVTFFGAEMYIDGNSLFMGGKSYSYEIVKPIEERTIMHGFTGDTGYDMEEAVIFPIKEVVLPTSSYPEIKISVKNSLYFRYLNDAWHEDLVAQLLRELNAANKKVIFEVDNEYLDLKREIDDLSYDMDRWMLVGVSVMFLSGIGCIGSVYLILNKRRHFIAISIAFGSTLCRIGAEMILEVFIVLFTGLVLGIASLPVLEQFTICQDELRFSIVGINIVNVFILFITVISVWLGMCEVNVRNVAAILKEE